MSAYFEARVHHIVARVLWHDEPFYRDSCLARISLKAAFIRFTEITPNQKHHFMALQIR